MPTSSSNKTALIIAASRGLGYAMAEAYLRHGWNVVGTVRGESGTRLHELAVRSDQRIEVETIDITVPDQIAVLRHRLEGRTFDLLFVNAGVANAHPEETVAEVSTELVRPMVTNAPSPMRVVEALQDLVPPTGTIGVMSSGQGSVANNINGMREVYRDSKAALNTFMRSFAARHQDDPRAMVLMAPGWVRTDVGGPEARLTIEDSVSSLDNVLMSVQGQAGLHTLTTWGARFRGEGSRSKGYETVLRSGQARPGRAQDTPTLARSAASGGNRGRRRVRADGAARGGFATGSRQRGRPRPWPGATRPIGRRWRPDGRTRQGRAGPPQRPRSISASSFCGRSKG
jgi:NAD(P)-dependent dehydrogenase (short-subunit alcohol dehydrogenase family)